MSYFIWRFSLLNLRLYISSNISNLGFNQCYAGMSILTYKLGIGIKFFFDLDIGCEHEYSNVLQINI
jgi:hypothetical protein